MGSVPTDEIAGTVITDRGSWISSESQLATWTLDYLVKLIATRDVIIVSSWDTRDYNIESVFKSNNTIKPIIN